MENKEVKDILPLGTIVVLKNGKRKIMITGRYQIKADTDELFDYLGCLYPEGIINADMNFLFNNEDINEIVHKGYSDDEDENFKSELEVLLSKRNK